MLTANFTKGVNGNTVASADAGDSNSWDTVSIAATCTLTYDSSKALLGGGVSAAKFVQGGTPGATTLQWIGSFGTQTDHYGRTYVWMDNYQGIANQSFVAALNGGSFGARAYINSSGQLVLTDSTGSGLANTTNVIIRGQWNRIEWHFIHSTTVGFVEAKLFQNPHSAVATETISTAANRNTLASVDRVVFGQAAAGVAGDTLWAGGILAQAQAYPGPIATVLQPQLLGRAGGGVA